MFWRALGTCSRALWSLVFINDNLHWLGRVHDIGCARMLRERAAQDIQSRVAKANMLWSEEQNLPVSFTISKNPKEQPCAPKSELEYSKFKL